MSKGDNLFIVDLTTVSFFNSERLKNIASNEEEYKRIPFLFLVSSYLKNSAISIAYSRMKYIDKKTIYSWDIYKFQKD